MAAHCRLKIAGVCGSIPARLLDKGKTATVVFVHRRAMAWIIAVGMYSSAKQGRGLL